MASKCHGVVVDGVVVVAVVVVSDEVLGQTLIVVYLAVDVVVASFSVPFSAATAIMPPIQTRTRPSKYPKHSFYR